MRPVPVLLPALLCCAVSAMPLCAQTPSTHSAVGRGPTEPDAKHNAKDAAAQTFGLNNITSWGRESCERQEIKADDRAPETPSPYTVPRTETRVVYVCEVEFTTKG